MASAGVAIVFYLVLLTEHRILSCASIADMFLVDIENFSVNCIFNFLPSYSNLNGNGMKRITLITE